MDECRQERRKGRKKENSSRLKLLSKFIQKQQIYLFILAKKK